MAATASIASTTPRPLRLVCSLVGSVALHAILILMIVFDVAGLGGGFGLGVGPGVGIGAGGGLGLGEKKRRQIFSLEDLPELMRPDDNEDRLAKLLEPEQRHAITIPQPTRRATHKTKGPVVKFSRPVKPAGASVDLSKKFAAAGAGIGGVGLGGGGGGAGWSLGFGKYVGSLRKQGLDVAIVIDSTGSMQNIIDELTGRLGTLVYTMQRLVPTARVGAVAFRDRADDKMATAPRQSEDFVVRWTDLTFSAKKVRGFLDGIVAEGGGDWEEAVKDGLQAAVGQLAWRPESKKVIILVGSSPPHEQDRGAVRTLVRQWRARGGYVSTIDVSQRLHEEHERKLHRWLYGEELTEISDLPDFYRQIQRSFGDIANDGGGKFIRLGQEGALTRHVLVLAFGEKWTKDMATISRGM